MSYRYAWPKQNVYKSTMHKSPVHQKQLLIHETPSRYTAKYSNLAKTDICNTSIVVGVDTERRANVVLSD